MKSMQIVSPLPFMKISNILPVFIQIEHFMFGTWKTLKGSPSSVGISRMSWSPSWGLHHTLSDFFPPLSRSWSLDFIFAISSTIFFFSILRWGQQISQPPNSFIFESLMNDSDNKYNLVHNLKIAAWKGFIVTHFRPEIQLTVNTYLKIAGFVAIIISTPVFLILNDHE